MASREDQERRDEYARDKAPYEHSRPMVVAAMESEAAHQRARYERLVKAAEACWRAWEDGVIPDSMFDELYAALADLREPEGGGPT